MIQFITEATADKPLGLLAPDGKYYPVEFATHSDSADEVAFYLFPEEWKAEKERQGWVDGLPFLRNRGWADIHSGCYVRTGRKLNQCQRDFIFDLAMRIKEKWGQETYEVRELMRVCGMAEVEA